MDSINCTNSRTTTYLVYHFAQQITKLVSQTKPSAHEHKDRSREEDRICILCGASVVTCKCSLEIWIYGYLVNMAVEMISTFDITWEGERTPPHAVSGTT